MVCLLVEVRHRGSAFVSRYSTIQSHREESVAVRPIFTSPCHRRRPIGNFPNRCFMYQQDSCFYRGGGNFAWMIRRNNSKKNKRRILLLLARLIPFLSMRFRERLSIRMQMAGRDRIREKERKNGNEEREREVKTKTKDQVSRSVCAIITFI